MTDRAKVFVKIIESVCWTKGWGTTGTTEAFPNIENGIELAWLVDNGYLFHFQREKCDMHRNWRYRYRTADCYGITKKGWAVAGKFIDAAGVELKYQFEHYPQRKEKSK